MNLDKMIFRVYWLNRLPKSKTPDWVQVRVIYGNGVYDKYEKKHILRVLDPERGDYSAYAEDLKTEWTLPRREKQAIADAKKYAYLTAYQ